MLALHTTRTLIAQANTQRSLSMKHPERDRHLADSVEKSHQISDCNNDDGDGVEMKARRHLNA